MGSAAVFDVHVHEVHVFGVHVHVHKHRRGNEPPEPLGLATSNPVCQSQPILCSVALLTISLPHTLHPTLCPVTGSRLLVNCTDSRLYLLNALAPSWPPVATLTGHQSPPGNNSFYIRCAFSPDGSHAMCGSVDKRAYIWQVGGSWAAGWIQGHITCPPNPTSLQR